MNELPLESIFADLTDRSRSMLIPVLQREQERSGYLSREAMVAIARELNLAPSKVFGVASFYNQFKFEAPGKFHIQVCRGTACHVKGSATLLETLERETKGCAGHTTRDGLFSIEVVACVGACSLAPVVVVNGKFHARMTDTQIRSLVSQLRQEVENE
ncbi:NAD(P)H-dependent oxidoreductase subunit E [Myxococcota bacterium]|nr:NAD(P)H-dependent oxidoreductase subunit E [Myxococcota bacterium]MBU1534350.1 NAD(P)H-dependent oxidoreductase subunit E [Myxococcota bacterium]